MVARQVVQENHDGRMSMSAKSRLNFANPVLRHFTRPGFFVSAAVLLITLIVRWIFAHYKNLEHSYHIDEFVLVFGLIISSLLYVSFSLWETLKKDLVQLQTANRSLIDQQALLRASQLHSQYLFETNPHPMWFFDLKTLRFVDVNEAAVRKYGYSREEFLSMTALDIRPPE